MKLDLSVLTPLAGDGGSTGAFSGNIRICGGGGGGAVDVEARGSGNEARGGTILTQAPTSVDEASSERFTPICGPGVRDETA